MIITAPFGLTQLCMKYGANWKFKDLGHFYKWVSIYLCMVMVLVIVLWTCIFVYALISII